MKKFFILSLSAVFALSLNAGAQAFNHLALGVGGGTDGLSFELAAPLGDHVQLRAGYGTALGLFSNTQKVTIPAHPLLNTTDVTTPMKLNLGMSDARLLFNIYPGQGGFHFTVGAYLGSSRYLRATLTQMPSVYETVGFEVDGYLVRATSGELKTALRAPGLGSGSFGVKPYVGIGFGRAVRADKRVTFSCDLGAQYQGKTSLWVSGESITGEVKEVQITEKNIKEAADSINEVSKYLTFWPTLNFHLYVRLF
ncbi:MAG: hypothetical protein K5849_06515 [Bacteroidales bacterium]|nr:hypothetical protein [Bacteroidales bacterium]